jgi:hypothetical protein
MSTCQNWDAIIALPYREANAHLQAEATTEQQWRRQAR